jgi:hypothetical protein
MLFSIGGSLKLRAVQHLWLAPIPCGSLSLARSSTMLFSIGGSLSYHAVPWYWLRSHYLLFHAPGSLTYFAVLSPWLALPQCCSHALARSKDVLFIFVGSLSRPAVA